MTSPKAQPPTALVALGVVVPACIAEQVLSTGEDLILFTGEPIRRIPAIPLMLVIAMPG